MRDNHQEETTKIYDLGASEYKSSTQDYIFPDGIFEYFLGCLPGKKILDIGCAFGRDIERMMLSGFEAQGLEISEGLIELAKPNIKRHITHGDMNDIFSIFGKEQFHGIFSAASLVHLDKKIVLDIIEQVHDTLKPEGIFFIGVKIASKSQLIFKESYSLPGIQKKYYYYTEKEIEQMLTEKGFKILKKNYNKHMNDDWIVLICKK